MEQKYQYSIDRVNWGDIEGAAFLIEKGIKQGGPTGWLYYFSKKNWAPFNNRPFVMEVEYPLQRIAPPAPNHRILKNPADADISQFAHSFNGTLVPWQYGMVRPQ